MVDPNAERNLVIDFRYHLISLVAVFLALGIGILLGSATLGGENVTGRLETSIESIRTTNDELRADNAELIDRQSLSEEALQVLAPTVLDGALAGEQVVLFEFEGSDAGLMESVRGAVEVADGSIASTVTLTAKLALEDPEARTELARILGSASVEPDELRAEVGATLGRRAATSADTPGFNVPDGNPSNRLQLFVDELEAANFVTVERDENLDLAPAGALFVLAGGNLDDPLFDIGPLTTSLAVGLAGREAGVLAAEPRNSLWGPAAAVRADGEAGGIIATVDQADIVLGQYAVAMGLQLAESGAPAHYGSEADTVPLPEPSPSS